MSVSLVDIVRNVVQAAAQNEDAEALQVIAKYLETDDATAWFATEVVDTPAFRTALKTPGMGVRDWLTQALSAAQEHAEGSPSAGPDCQCLVDVTQLLIARWNGADLDHDEDQDDNDAEVSYKYMPTVNALLKAKEQIPMLVAVQQALALFPEGLADKLDAQAANVGDSVRK
ncbi:MAG: hypothetical protein ACPG1A_13350, partial [Halioglobus sp.]